MNITNWNYYLQIEFVCPINTFFCKNDKICISSLEVCDGKSDCFSGEDEFDCKKLSKFHCLTGGETIPYQYLCNNKQDCNDGSDEKFCGIFSFFFLE